MSHPEVIIALVLAWIAVVTVVHTRKDRPWDGDDDED